MLSYCPNNRSHKKGGTTKFRTIGEAAMLMFPHDMILEPDMHRSSKSAHIEPVVFPLVLHILSTIPVAVHLIGGDDGPIDIGARLYMNSYFC